MNLLIIDDDVMVLRATARAMKALGWEVDTLDSLRDFSPVGYDVVLTDWQPFGADAVAMCKRLGVPVVVYTGVPESVLAGISIVSKPFEPRDLNVVLALAAKHAEALPPVDALSPQRA